MRSYDFGPPNISQSANTESRNPLEGGATIGGRGGVPKDVRTDVPRTSEICQKYKLSIENVKLS